MSQSFVSRSEQVSPTSFLDGGGELGALMRAFDFSKTPLGTPATWPRALKTAVRIMLTSRQPFWIAWGPELTYLYNDPYLSIIGGKHPHALGRPFREVWHEIWDVIGPMAEQVVTHDEGTYVEAQLLIMQRHGYQEETYYTFSYSPIPGDDGETAGIICANTDDTRRVIGERQLHTLRELSLQGAKARTRREACERSVAALGVNPKDLPFVLVYLTDTNAEAPLLAASSPGAGALESLESWPWARVLDSQQLAVVELEQRPEAIPLGAWPRPPSRAVVLPLAASGSTGRGGVLVAGLSPYRPLDDGYRGFLDLVARQVASNVANAESYEEERRRTAALLALDRAKTEFFSNVSHEFRTPLTLMLGPLEDTLTESDALSAADRERLELAHRNSLRLLRLVNTLLDFSRIESGRMEASYEPVDLGTFTAELASVFRTAIERAGLRYVVDGGGLEHPIYVDREMWEKVVFNLLSNALKFTFEGTIRVEVAERDGGAELSVSDTGTGIPARDLPHVFERFHRVEGARGRTVEGSGIGLALVQELVKLHGGRVQVESEVDRGSTFRVWLPSGQAHLPAARIGATRALASTGVRGAAYVDEALGWVSREEAPTEPGVAVVEPGDAPRARLLLCEDNADMRGYLVRLLQKSYEVEAVGDGNAALAAARREPPRLILTDVMMPGLDGFGLLREIRADERLQRVPVIMLSARAGESARIEGIRAGADDYVVKPFSARELLARVSARLEVSRLETERAAAERALHEEAKTLETLKLIGRLLTADLDLESILQAVTDAATEISGAAFGAFFYNVVNELGEAFLLYTLSGAPREAFAKFGTPRNTPVFAPTFRGEGPVRVDDITKDPRYGTLGPHHGMPAGHLPVRSYLAVPVRSRSGEVLGGLFFGHPVPGVFTERAEGVVAGIAVHAAAALDAARLYQQRSELVEQLRESDRRKDEFLATLSHELRNPLAPLQNALQSMRLAGAGAVPDANVRDIMERQVGHLVRLVDDLLEVSRISRGAFELRRERVEVASVVRNAIETSEPLLRGARHAVEVVLPDEPLVVDGDPTRLTQILANLLNNSAKYTPAGGHVAVRVARDGELVAISVADDGMGITPEALPRIFEMFTRGSIAMGLQGGLGIGLALVKKLAEMHGGSIVAKSDGPGRGSVFTLTLPLAAGPATAGVERTATPVPHKKRVLVVDDNIDAAETLAMLLGMIGADVHVTHDGPAALAAFATSPPELVLLDIGMPGMDGYEVARRLRALDPEHRVSIVALTGWGQNEDRRLAREAGFDHHLVKPANLDALRAILGAEPR